MVGVDAEVGPRVEPQRDGRGAQRGKSRAPVTHHPRHEAPEAGAEPGLDPLRHPSPLEAGSA